MIEQRLKKAKVDFEQVFSPKNFLATKQRKLFFPRFVRTKRKNKQSFFSKEINKIRPRNFFPSSLTQVVYSLMPLLLTRLPLSLSKWILAFRLIRIDCSWHFLLKKNQFSVSPNQSTRGTEPKWEPKENLKNGPKFWNSLFWRKYLNEGEKFWRPIIAKSQHGEKKLHLEFILEWNELT